MPLRVVSDSQTTKLQNFLKEMTDDPNEAVGIMACLMFQIYQTNKYTLEEMCQNITLIFQTMHSVETSEGEMLQ